MKACQNPEPEKVYMVEGGMNNIYIYQHDTIKILDVYTNWVYRRCSEDLYDFNWQEEIGDRHD